MLIPLARAFLRLGRVDLAIALAATVLLPALAAADETSRFPGTKPLQMEGDIASQMVGGIDRFLLRKLESSVNQRAQHWQRDVSSAEAYSKSVEPNRQRLAQILGLRANRKSPELLLVAAAGRTDGIVASCDAFQVQSVRWPVIGAIVGEGLLLRPSAPPQANVIVLPDADQTPEQVVGLVAGVDPAQQIARHLAQSGCRVLVPSLISRRTATRGVPERRGAVLTDREFVYRPAFELGRHVIGYEVQTVRSAIDLLQTLSPSEAHVGLFGYGEGGLLSLAAAALDRRIDAAVVSGYFDRRQDLWQEPLDRNVFDYLTQFGDAELASLVAPRPLLIEASAGPQLELPGQGGAPGRLVSPQLEAVQQEFARAEALTKDLGKRWMLSLIVSGDHGQGPHGTATAGQWLLDRLECDTKLDTAAARLPYDAKAAYRPDARRARQVDQMQQHNETLLVASPFVRRKFMERLDTSSLEKYAASAEPYREFFYEKVIGRFPDEPLPPAPRSRLAYDESKWTGYEVVLDVFPDVIAYGILLMPKGIEPGERRPAVVCQHGLEGRPQDVVAGDHRAYHDFAAKLAERGFVVFAPQNPYIFGDRFRTLQRKANPLGKTLFSIITPQHQQIVDWLQTLPQVDPERIGFYGLSYGGKTAMRVPALVTDYALSICSADFNEWVLKNASTRHRFSYVWTGEYEIFEFDLGGTFNYAEMAALICPRPFMVERGHFDGVGLDHWVAHEYAKVRHLYAAKLDIPDRTEIEWFVGPHTINGQGTFDFLHRHLSWPRPKAK